MSDDPLEHFMEVVIMVMSMYIVELAIFYLLRRRNLERHTEEGGLLPEIPDPRDKFLCCFQMSTRIDHVVRGIFSGTTTLLAVFRIIALLTICAVLWWSISTTRFGVFYFSNSAATLAVFYFLIVAFVSIVRLLYPILLAPDWEGRRYVRVHWSNTVRTIAMAAHVTFEIVGGAVVFAIIFDFHLFPKTDNTTAVQAVGGTSLLMLCVELILCSLEVRFDQYPGSVASIVAYFMMMWPSALLGLIPYWPYEQFRTDRSECFIYYGLVMILNFFGFLVWYSASRAKKMIIAYWNCGRLVPSAVEFFNEEGLHLDIEAAAEARRIEWEQQRLMQQQQNDNYSTSSDGKRQTRSQKLGLAKISFYSTGSYSIYGGSNESSSEIGGEGVSILGGGLDFNDDDLDQMLVSSNLTSVKPFFAIKQKDVNEAPDMSPRHIEQMESIDRFYDLNYDDPITSVHPNIAESSGYFGKEHTMYPPSSPGRRSSKDGTEPGQKRKISFSRLLCTGSRSPSKRGNDEDDAMYSVFQDESEHLRCSLNPLPSPDRRNSKDGTEPGQKRKISFSRLLGTGSRSPSKRGNDEDDAMYSVFQDESEHLRCSLDPLPSPDRRSSKDGTEPGQKRRTSFSGWLGNRSRSFSASTHGSIIEDDISIGDIYDQGVDLNESQIFWSKKAESSNFSNNFGMTPSWFPSPLDWFGDFNMPGNSVRENDLNQPRKQQSGSELLTFSADDNNKIDEEICRIPAEVEKDAASLERVNDFSLDSAHGDGVMMQSSRNYVSSLFATAGRELREQNPEDCLLDHPLDDEGFSLEAVCGRNGYSSNINQRYREQHGSRDDKKDSTSVRFIGSRTNTPCNSKQSGKEL